MRITARPEKTGGVLATIKAWAKKHRYSDVRVQIDLPNNRSRSFSIVREADAADVLFVRSERVNVETSLPPCAKTINEELVRKAVTIFAAEEAQDEGEQERDYVAAAVPA